MIIVITRPDFFEGEAEKIAQLLQSGGMAAAAYLPGKQGEKKPAEQE